MPGGCHALQWVGNFLFFTCMKRTHLKGDAARHALPRLYTCQKVQIKMGWQLLTYSYMLASALYAARPTQQDKNRFFGMLVPPGDTIACNPINH